jgi:hypothetical protein
MKRIIPAVLFIGIIFSCSKQKDTRLLPSEFKISIVQLKDKIRGGWAGQTIGCTYGGPTEFKFKGTMIQDYQPINWYDNYPLETFQLDPGLYDDVYMDLTFVEVLERVGLDAPADSFAQAFARADYKLWHANQASRYNILNGIMPPASGHWLNNPHADDIDFQIEADFAGMMTPGMVNTGSSICNTTGHIMNYGDGWYGGVFMSAMYSLAFVSSDIPFIINEALSTIPVKSRFYQTISDVISWHENYPDDWKRCWFEVEKKHTSEKGCPEGVFNAFNIDASESAAYVVMGLLYGNKDFFKTIDIATRSGQDSDCNPATAGGILGVILGYSKIPAFWKPGVEKIENINFPYTTISLERVYGLSLKHGLELIARNGGSVKGDEVTLKVQQPQTVQWEQSFEGMYPKERRVYNKDIAEGSMEHEFEGTGIVCMGAIKRITGESQDYVALLNVYLDEVKTEEVKMPFDYIIRKYDIWHKYMLPKGKHTVRIEWINPDTNFRINMKDVVIYSDTLNIPLAPAL